MSDVALLIAESIWFSPKENKGQASFNEYGQAIANLIKFGGVSDSFGVYRAGFYEKKSLEKCLEHLVDTTENRQILYVGAHGDGKKVAGVKLKDLGEAVGNKAGKIKGVYVSSCWAGSSDVLAENLNWGVADNSISGPNWVVAYKHAVGWHLSALLEMHVLYSVCGQYCYDAKSLNSRAAIVDLFRDALRIFNKDMPLGGDGESLEDTFRLWVRPQGSSELKEATDELFQY